MKTFSMIAMVSLRFYQTPLGDYVIIQDTNLAIVTYARLWNELKAHLQSYFVYVDDPP